MNLTHFGRNNEREFVIIVEQPFVAGVKTSQEEIVAFMSTLGFKPYNKRKIHSHCSTIFITSNILLLNQCCPKSENTLLSLLWIQQEKRMQGLDLFHCYDTNARSSPK